MMAPETFVFALTVLLGFVHVLVQSVIQMSIHGAEELVGPRDSFQPADNVYLGRAQRANDNFRETAPLAIGLLIMVQVADVSGTVTVMGAWLYLIARVVYLPLYLVGVRWLRTVAWMASIVGLGMLLSPLLL